MKLKTAIDLAKNSDLDLETYEDVYGNIEYHAVNIFPYAKISDELDELRSDIQSLANERGIPMAEFLKEPFNKKFGVLVYTDDWSDSNFQILLNNVFYTYKEAEVYRKSLDEGVKAYVVGILEEDE
ncbi:hypothetical protein [Enterococcus casseliflavus]|uniref:hypothetical protein n=1 Tax=Enterococcus casseliflavus TaxID=37734 RepID=UPI0030175CBB